LNQHHFLFLFIRRPPSTTVLPYTTLFRSEEVLATHPAVMEVGVAGMPDAAKGEVAHAWVVLRPGSSATADELRAFCRERLAPYRSEEHTSELQSRSDLVCRLLLEKKKIQQ